MNKHAPAFPNEVYANSDAKMSTILFGGLTKYEKVAADFMAAMIGSSSVEGVADATNEELALWAFNAADAFFAELEKRGVK